jgi:hypothetical protein
MGGHDLPWISILPQQPYHLFFHAMGCDYGLVLPPAKRSFKRALSRHNRSYYTSPFVYPHSNLVLL